MTENREIIELIEVIKNIIPILMAFVCIIVFLNIARKIIRMPSAQNVSDDCKPDQPVKKLNRKWLRFNLERILKKYHINKVTITNIRQVIEMIDKYSNLLESKQIKYIALEKTEQINKINILKQEFATNLKEMIIENYSQDVIQKYCRQTYYMIDDLEREFKKLVKAKQETRLSDKIQITNDLIN